MQKDGIQRITIEVPKELHAHIKAACAERGESISMALTRTLRAEFGWDSPGVVRLADWSGWTPEFDATLLRLWPTMSAKWIAIELGATRSAVLSRYHRLQGNGEQYRQTQRAKDQAETQARRQAKTDVLNSLKQNLAQGTARDTAILTALEAGATHRAVANVLGLTQQRITQIAARSSTGRKVTTKESRAA